MLGEQGENMANPALWPGQLTSFNNLVKTPIEPASFSINGATSSTESDEITVSEK